MPRRSPQRLFEGPPQADANIFGCVMFVNLEIAARLSLEIEEAMPGQERQHVIKEADACVYLGGAAAIQRQLEDDLRLLCRSFDSGLSHKEPGLALFVNLPRYGQIAISNCASSGPYSSMPEEQKLAVPFVEDRGRPRCANCPIDCAGGQTLPRLPEVSPPSV